jgi:hypothetical protein
MPNFGGGGHVAFWADPITMLFTAAQNVRFWHKADISTRSTNVCFRGKSGHDADMR